MQRRTRVTVFGSFDPQRAHAEKNAAFSLEGTLDGFISTCRELGRRLAARGLILNVCSDTPETADLHVALGFVEEARKRRDSGSSLHIFRPRSRRSSSAPSQAFKNLLEDADFRGLVTLADGRGDTWNVTHLRALRASDAVIILGGLSNSYTAGNAAVLAEKRLIPITDFGGAAARISGELGEEIKAPFEQAGLRFSDLSLPCTSKNNYAVLDTAISMAVFREKPKVFMIHGHSEDWRALQQVLDQKHYTVVDMQTEGRIGETMPQRFEMHATSAAAAIAFVTPDDWGWNRSASPWECCPRARQNVWLEVGWFWGRLGRDRVLLLIRNCTNGPQIERPSDLAGLDVRNYSQSPAELMDQILKFLEQLETS